MMKSTAIEKSSNIEPTATREWLEDRIIYIKLTDGRIFGFPAIDSEY